MTIKHCWERVEGDGGGGRGVFFYPILTASLPNTHGASCQSLHKFSSDPDTSSQEHRVDKAENKRPCVLRDRGGLKKTKKNASV